MNRKLTLANNPNFLTFLLIVEPANLTSVSWEEVQESWDEGVREDDLVEGDDDVVVREDLEDEEQELKE